VVDLRKQLRDSIKQTEEAKKATKKVHCCVFGGRGGGAVFSVHLLYVPISNIIIIVFI
jgi:hypothetical protein